MEAGRGLTVRKVGLKQIIIAPRNLLHSLGKLQPLRVGEIDQRADMALRDDEHLERPHGPPGAHDEEAVVLPDHALALLRLELGVVRQQVPAVLPPVLGHLRELLAGLLGQRAGGPDLAVRVRVGAAHGGALVLEDLHVPQLTLGRIDLAVGVGGKAGQDLVCLRLERVRGRQVAGVDAGPGLDDGQDLGSGHVGQGEVVLGREGEHVAPAGDGLGLEQEGGDVIFAGLGGVLLLLLLHGAVVVDKGEGVFVLRVAVSLSALVPRAQVALRWMLND